MKFFLVYGLAMSVLCISGIAVAQSNSESAIPNDLVQDSRWRYRLIVACNYDRSETGNKLYIFNANDPVEPYQERDLIYVSKSPKSSLALKPYIQNGKSGTHIRTFKSKLEGLSRLAQCQPNQNSIALIGKDGTLKQNWTTPVKAETIFELIDAMPMRQQEMREQKEGQ